MAGLFGGKSKMPPPPKPQRMPVESDPSVRAAAERARMQALNRSGFQSTILTDQTQQTVGAAGAITEKPLKPTMSSSGGTKLGA